MLTPTQSNLVYLAYGIAILALPFAILVGLIVGQAVEAARRVRGRRRHRPARAVGHRPDGIAAPQWHFDLSDRPNTFLSQFLDDPRWIAMLAAVLTVSGPWLPARWRRWWWALLLAFVPIHLVVSAVVPARSLLGLAVGWFVGALVVLVVGTPAPGGAARRRRAGDGPTRMRGDRADRDAARRARIADLCRPIAPTDSTAVHRDVRPEPTQRRSAAPAVAKGAAARRRDRALPRLDAPHRRAPRADGDRHR